MKAKIDLEKFICSLMERYYETININSTTTKCWLDDVLEDQGLEYKNGEIVEIEQSSKKDYEDLSVIDDGNDGVLLYFIKDGRGISDFHISKDTARWLHGRLRKYLEMYDDEQPKEKKSPFNKERLMEVAKPETPEEKVEHWQRMRDIAMEEVKRTFKEEDSPETKAIKEQIENLKKRIEDNQLGCIVQRLDKIIELLQSAILVLPKEPYVPSIIYKRPLDPDPNVLGGWTTTASTFGNYKKFYEPPVTFVKKK